MGDLQLRRSKTRRMRDGLTEGLGRRSELEERMASSLGDVLLERVVDADPVPYAVRSIPPATNRAWRRAVVRDPQRRVAQADRSRAGDSARPAIRYRIGPIAETNRMTNAQIARLPPRNRRPGRERSHRIERDQCPRDVIRALMRKEIPNEITPTAWNDLGPRFRVAAKLLALGRVDLIPDETRDHHSLCSL